MSAVGEFALVDYYEKMVKEYLEQQGYAVRLCIRFLKTRGYSGIDVFAINPIQEKTIVGEVKAYGLNKKEIDHENEDFNSARCILYLMKSFCQRESYPLTISLA